MLGRDDPDAGHLRRDRVGLILRVGDRVVVPFTIACGRCYFCERGLWSACDNSNPNAWMAEKMWGHSPCGIYGYSHLLGGYAGGQAEYARVPFADVGPLRVPDSLSDEQVEQLRRQMEQLQLVARPNVVRK